MFCQKCGNQIENGQRFCPKCGNCVTDAPTGGTGATSRSTGEPWGALLMFIFCVLSLAIPIFGIIMWACNHKVPSKKNQASTLLWISIAAIALVFISSL